MEAEWLRRMLLVTISNRKTPVPAGLPCTRQACRARIVDLQDEIAAIKAQIAAADLERQQKRGQMDARWFHRARTALRHRQREMSELAAHMAALPREKPGRPGFKDCLIEVLRAHYSDEEWRAALDEAHRIHKERRQV
jgi:hypothetical protein